MNSGRATHKAIALIATVACVAFLGSCAAKSAQTTPSASKGASEDATPTSAPPPRAEGNKQRIRDLYDQIVRWTGTASPDSPESPDASAGKLCTAPQPKTPRCTDVCRLKGSICGNAGKICELAKGIPDDTWATEKCSSANAACERATRRCCGCVDGE